MTTWEEFTTLAPRIAGIFTRRHAATGNLCMLATNRPDGFPRISPMEPRMVDGGLWIAGMPDTAKFADLAADPRFSLHTATVDTEVTEGDAKIWGTVEDVRDPALHARYAEVLLEVTGMDFRGQTLQHLYRPHLVGASSVEVIDGHLDITVWHQGEAERVVRKH